jgi:hypothetical protein
MEEGTGNLFQVQSRAGRGVIRTSTPKADTDGIFTGSWVLSVLESCFI